MNTRQTVERYFDLLRNAGAWDAMLADDIDFTRLTTPAKRVTGKTAYLEATRRFYASIASLNIRELVVEGERAFALTEYLIRMPSGDRFESYVAELFTVRDTKISALSICFDLSPYPKG